MASGDAIEVRNLTKKYPGCVALDGVSFGVKKGAIVGLIGPNGAGKSSLLKILAGIIRGTDGDILINGVSIADGRIGRHNMVAFMPENNPLPGHMRVGEYLRFRAGLKGVASQNIRTATEKVMRQCGLYRDARYKMIKTLSKGYRQRVGIADAMLGDADIVLLDEPTAGLDPAQIVEVKEIISEIKGTRTVIISSHILPQLEEICDSFIILNKGKIIANGTLCSLATMARQSSGNTIVVHGNEKSIHAIFEKNTEIKASVDRDNDGRYTIAADETASKMILKKCLEDGAITVDEFKKAKCSLEEIFMDAITRDNNRTTK